MPNNIGFQTQTSTEWNCNSWNENSSFHWFTDQILQFPMTFNDTNNLDVEIPHFTIYRSNTTIFNDFEWYYKQFHKYYITAPQLSK